MVEGISTHPHSRKWQPGAGGLCMHTILRDGNHVHVGISTGGHYLSEDGGETFKASNQGVDVGFAPEAYPEFGQCVHKLAKHPKAPDACTCRTTAAGPTGMARGFALSRGLPERESFFTIQRDGARSRPGPAGATSRSACAAWATIAVTIPPARRRREAR